MALKKLSEGESVWGKPQEKRRSVHMERVERLSLENVHTEGFIFENNLCFPIT